MAPQVYSELNYLTQMPRKSEFSFEIVNNNNSLQHQAIAWTNIDESSMMSSHTYQWIISLVYN